MIKDQVNVNTYLNLLIALILAFFGYVGTQYEKKFDFLGAEMERKFNFLREDIKANGEKIDRLIEIVNDNKVDIARTEEKQASLEVRIENIESELDITLVQKE
ncbi:MAG: hypothetical protein O3B09_00850 [Proteobacteria bacterium]|nr:hypothetical protein [Pseudomonadota bacterium]